MKLLGTIMITVSADETGAISAEHDTSLEPALAEMQGAMSGAEKTKAVELRRRACAAAANFFLFVQNPDRSQRAR